MLGLKLNHVSKRGHRCCKISKTCECMLSNCVVIYCYDSYEISERSVGSEPTSCVFICREIWLKNVLALSDYSPCNGYRHTYSTWWSGHEIWHLPAGCTFNKIYRPTVQQRSFKGVQGCLNLMWCRVKLSALWRHLLIDTLQIYITYANI